MTVCFDFNPQETPWVAPYDRYNVFGFSMPDGKISTSDVNSIPNVLARYTATPVLIDDRRLCDAFYVEMVKLGFYNEVIRPQAEAGTTVFQDKNTWIQHILKSQATALEKIARRQQASNSDGYYTYEGYYLEWECDWMGDCVPNSFISAKNFINCVANEAAKSVYAETPITAGPGIVLKREPGKPPALVAADNEADYTLERLNVMVSFDDVSVGSIDGVPTDSMTDEDMQAALSGPEDSYVKLQLVDFDWSAENISSAEPREAATLWLPRKLSMSRAITECGGIDVKGL